MGEVDTTKPRLSGRFRSLIVSVLPSLPRPRDAQASTGSGPVANTIWTILSLFISLTALTFGSMFAGEVLEGVLASILTRWAARVIAAGVVSSASCLIVYLVWQRWGRVEDRLRRVEAGYQALVEQIPAITYTTALGADPDTLFISPQVEAMLGYPQRDWLADRQLWSRHLHPNDRDRVVAEATQLHASGAPISMEYRMIARDGREVWFSDTGVVVRDDAGQPLGYQGVMLDIGERKRAEAALRQNEQKYRSVIEQSSDGIVVVDERGAIIEWNPSMTRITGLTRDEVLGQPAWNLAMRVLPESARTVYSQDSLKAGILDLLQRQGALASRQPYELELLGPDGAPRCVQTSTFTISLNTGTMVGIICQDITDRKRATEALRESERHYRSVFSQMTEGFAIHEILCDDRGIPCNYRFLDVNPAFEKLTGLRRDDVVGKTLFEVMPGSELFWVQTYGQVALTGQSTHFEHFSTVLQRHFEVYAYCPTPREFATLFVDITERKQSEQKLAHERNLLRTIIDNLPDYIYVKDRVGRFVVNNLALARSTQFATPGALVGKTDRDLHPAERAAQFQADEQVLFQTGQPLINQEEFVVDASGRSKWVMTTKVPLQDSLGHVVGLVGIGRDITARKRADEQIRRQLETLTALYNGAQQLAGSLDSLQLAEEVARNCVQGFDLSLAWVGRADPDGRVQVLAQFPAEVGYPQQVVVRWDDTPEGRGPAGRAIRTGVPAPVSDLTQDAAVSSITPWREAIRRHGLRGAVALPLVSRQRAFGVLMLYSDQPGVFTPERVQFFQSYALLAAAALENARLFEETGRRLNQVQALRKIDLAITSSLSLPLTLDVILDQTVEQLGVDAASVLLLDPLAQRLDYVAGRGFHTPVVMQTHLRLGVGNAGRAAVERRTIISGGAQGGEIDTPGGEGAEGTEQAPADLRDQALSAAEGFAAHLATPLLAKGQVQGVLEVFHRAPNASADSEWLAFMEMLAGQAAIAIDNATLVEGLQRSKTELEMAYTSTLEGWSHALDLRDMETAGHTERVARVTVQLAQALGLSGPELTSLYRGALLHDIGKLGVPDHILLKPGSLTEEEMAVMRKHPQYAYDMLAPITYLRSALDIPYCHHEKWDGTGYPRGLQGESIPLAARIFAVVDVWDALRSGRPYRVAWPDDIVREHLHSLAGTHFDPRVVQAFLQLDMAPENASPSSIAATQ